MASVTTLTVMVLVLCRQFFVLESFQWTQEQQSRDVISAVAGSSVTLPCEYQLTAQDQQQADDFFMVTWMREAPQGSGQWVGLAIRSSLHESRVLADDESRVILLNDTALELKGVTEVDHTKYQCAFQSSFLTTPFTIQLNVQFKPHSTKLSLSEENVVEGMALNVTCTARANPAPVYKFYAGEELVQNSPSNVYTIASAGREDSGLLKCVPANFLGEGPADTIQLNVEATAGPSSGGRSGLPYWVYVTIGGGALLILVLVSLALWCRQKAGNNSSRRPGSRGTTDAPGAHSNDAVLRNGFSASLNDVRTNAHVPQGKHLRSLPDIREDLPMTNAGFGGSLNDVRHSAFIPAGMHSASLNNVYERNVHQNNLRNSTLSTGSNELVAGSALQLIRNGGDDTRL